MLFNLIDEKLVFVYLRNPALKSLTKALNLFAKAAVENGEKESGVRVSNRATSVWATTDNQKPVQLSITFTHSGTDE